MLLMLMKDNFIKSHIIFRGNNTDHPQGLTKQHNPSSI